MIFQENWKYFQFSRNIKLEEQAIKDGFKLRKPTGAKDSALYYICHRGGKNEEKETQAKRSKSSIKISID